ncbi:hypothetical protein E8E11_001751 [Didymella keratinophila]|nr:hypothetical protein E8E11_001751 [Didymella keratinophila]
MNTVRTLTLAAVAGAGAVAEAFHAGIPQGEIIEMLPKVARDVTCAELPKLCTAPLMMHGYPTIVTYLCPETITSREKSTVHVTITKTTTVAPSSNTAATNFPTIPVPAPSTSCTEDPDITTTIHSTKTEYTTITLVYGTSSDAPTAPIAASITGYLSVTIPAELSSAAPTATETETDPVYTIQTSTDPAVTSTSGYAFPTMSPPVVNGTTTGIFYSPSVANSTLVQPTPFFSNTTSAGPHYVAPTTSFVNRAPEEVTNSAGELDISLVVSAIGTIAMFFAA